MTASFFESQFEQSYEFVRSLYLSRQKPIDYSWLLTNNHCLVPDYFTIQTMGRNLFERFLNRSMGVFFGSNGIGFKVMQRFVDLFYMIVQYDESESKGWLLKRLRKPPKEIAYWTLVEFFLFMDNWLRGICGVDFMTFKSTKVDLNNLALDLIQSCDHQLRNCSITDWLNIVCYSNWLDVVVPDFQDRKAAVFDHLKGMVQAVSTKSTISGVLDLTKAKHVLYECDNAGEAVFDLRFVLELIKMGKKVTMVAKIQPILNDVTCKELQIIIHENTVFDRLKNALKSNELTIISANDFPMVGKYLPLVTSEYKAAYLSTDIVILKGQANFQTMPVINHFITSRKINYTKPIMTCFVAKAPIVQYCLRYSNIKDVVIGDPVIGLI
ncbi:MAG: ARMT1-like domain-containing protein [Candidatus Margulisiibacteriota bacterium]|nr:ARMT1-like domain-containing protein [Candidatus Margulisiibacteriota bacterium]